MKQTPNLSLKKPDLTDVVNIEDLNQNFDTIDTEIKGAKDRADEAFQSASDGKGKIATAITGKGVTTSSSDTFTKMATNIDSIVTDKTGDATAVAGDILATKTAYAKTAKVTGTMLNNGSIGTKNLATEGAEYTIPAGYHNGAGKVKAVITGLVAGVIKAGSTVGGILGTFTSDATAIASNILAGKSGYVNGVKVTGTMANYDKSGINDGYVESLQTKADGFGNITMSPPTGYYVEGVNDVGHGSLIGTDPDFISANFLSTKNIFGMQGGIIDRSEENGHQPALATTVSDVNGYGVYLQVPAGYYNGGTWVRSLQPDVSAGNILAGKNICGVAGGIPNREYAWNPPVTTAVSGDGLYVIPPWGYFGGNANYPVHGGVHVTEPNFKAWNIPAGMSMFGLAGTKQNRRFVTGQANVYTSFDGWWSYRRIGVSDSTSNYHQHGSTKVTGLGFIPTMLILLYNSGRGITVSIVPGGVPIPGLNPFRVTVTDQVDIKYFQLNATENSNGNYPKATADEVYLPVPAGISGSFTYYAFE